MKGDFSRTTFDRTRHYHRVLQQQGRVHVDADWNEAHDIEAHLRGTTARDTIGLPGAPSANAGFAIGVNPLATDLTISAGRLYVDGVLCENESAVALRAQPDLPLASGALTGFVPPASSGRYLVYVDAWERHVSALLDPSIRETALGGPDTAGRAKLTWQVRLQPVGPAQTSDDFDASWAPPQMAGGGTMFAQTDPAPPAGPCVLPPLAGYRLLTNQLYRVEIHQSGWVGTPPPGYTGGTTPTFKWSRDNGTVVAVVAGITGQNVTITQTGPDVAASFLPGQWVELIDARSELTNQHGQLLKIASVVPQTGTIVIDNATAVAPVDLTQPTLLRRWDQVGNAAAGVPVTKNKTSLDPGISVVFSDGGYRAGDYWTFPARTAIDAETGTITWPGGNAPLPPRGIVHHYAPLALVDYAADRGTFALVEDCRTVFDPLTGRLPLFRARWLRAGSPVALAQGQDLGLDALQSGISIGCSTALDGTSITPGSVQLVAEVPVTVGRLNGTNDTRYVGTQQVSLACNLEMAGTKRFTVTPSPAAADLLRGALLAPQGAVSQTVQDLFTTADFGTTKAAWTFTQDGYLSAQGGIAPFLRSIALSRPVLDGAVAHVGTTVMPNSTATMRAGLVFNYRSSADFWVFYYANASFSIGFSGGYEAPKLGVAHFINGQPDGQPFEYTPLDASHQNVAATSVQLDITPGQSQLNFAFSAVYNDKSTPPQTLQIPFAGAQTPPLPTQLLAGSQIGVFQEGSATAVFQRLDWTRGTEQIVVVLPAGGGGRILARLVARPSAIRSTLQTAQSSALQLPIPRTPVPDFETHFWIVPTLGSYPYHGTPPASSPPPVSSPPPISSPPPVSSPPPISSPPIFSSGPGPIFSSGPRQSPVGLVARGIGEKSIGDPVLVDTTPPPSGATEA